jgi:DNA repair exonuclease SbcCD nuclease subunit
LKHFCVFSDLHLHAWQYGSTIIDGKNSRLQGQIRVVQDIIKYCTEKDISQCVFTGDLFHASTISAEVSQAAYEAFKGFKENKIDLTIIVGNHDQSSASGATHALSFFSELGRVVGMPHSGDVLEGNAGHVCNNPALYLPYTSSAEQLQSWLSDFQGGFLFLHQGVGGVEVNSKGFTLNEILTPDMIPDSCAMAFTGHYHSNKLVSNNLIIPGSTMQHNWGDQNEPRGWLDVSVDGDVVHDIQLIPSNSPQFITITENQLAEGTQPEIKGHFVRVLSDGNFSPEELTDSVLHKYGAASVEIKRTEIKAAKIESATMPSFNEMVLSYATAKERAGVINAYDKTIGEALLRNNYQLPSV